MPNHPTEKRKLCIATPSLDGKFDWRYVAALMETQKRLIAKGIQYEYTLEVGCSLIAAARNSIVAGFLNSDATDLVLIDSDIAWKPDDFMRLLEWDTPVVAGVYQLKSEKLGFSAKFGQDIKSRNGLLTARLLPTGFLRLRRDALESMIANADAIGLKSYLSATEDRTLTHAFFDTGIADDGYVGEDYFFCELWKKNGGECLFDPEITLQHIGVRVYDASIKDFLTPGGGSSGK